MHGGGGGKRALDQPIRQHDDRPLERCWGLGDEAAHEPDAAARERLAIDSSSTKWVRKALDWANVPRGSLDRAAVRGEAGGLARQHITGRA